MDDLDRELDEMAEEILRREADWLTLANHLSTACRQMGVTLAPTPQDLETARLQGKTRGRMFRAAELMAERFEIVARHPPGTFSEDLDPRLSARCEEIALWNRLNVRGRTR
jgi:hypothetical protein